MERKHKMEIHGYAEWNEEKECWDVKIETSETTYWHFNGEREYGTESYTSEFEVRTGDEGVFPEAIFVHNGILPTWDWPDTDSNYECYVKEK